MKKLDYLQKYLDKPKKSKKRTFDQILENAEKMIESD